MILSCILVFVLAGCVSASISKQRAKEVEHYLVLAVALISLFVFVLSASFFWGYSMPIAMMMGVCGGVLLTHYYYDRLL